MIKKHRSFFIYYRALIKSENISSKANFKHIILTSNWRFSQPNPPIIVLIAITIATTTCFKKKSKEFPKLRRFFPQTLSLPETFALNVFVVFGNSHGYD